MAGLSARARSNSLVRKGCAGLGCQRERRLRQRARAASRNEGLEQGESDVEGGSMVGVPVAGGADKLVARAADYLASCRQVSSVSTPSTTSTASSDDSPTFCSEQEQQQPEAVEVAAAAAALLDAVDAVLKCPLLTESIAMPLAPSPTALAPCTENNLAQDVQGVVDEAVVVNDGDAERPTVGSIVMLGAGAPPEYRQHEAVVMQVHAGHCSVIVLDEEGRFGIGECWPCFKDVVQVKSWSVDAKVRICGLKGAQATILNGQTGVIRADRKQGHPAFIEKANMPGKPLLVLCIKLDDPESAGKKTMLIEPRFLELR
eukprot:TRINITY_DN81485_c0_g1_i1.p1 TRINITY_DN81485_c0_g1~~TRINITY_DN81485_c0_g1_i1.p1  ORF type:complete len:353 (+),score=61.06 TRINITY_DN81485_c0_g1_i1:114-1061(+)